jgi:hypothetical protein
MFTPKKENFQKFEVVLPFGEFSPKEKMLTPTPSPTWKSLSGSFLANITPPFHPLYGTHLVGNGHWNHQVGFINNHY